MIEHRLDKLRPDAHDASGLLEKHAQLCRSSAAQAAVNAREFQLKGDHDQKLFNDGWQAAMNHAAHLAERALAAFRGE